VHFLSASNDLGFFCWRARICRAHASIWQRPAAFAPWAGSFRVRAFDSGRPGARFAAAIDRACTPLAWREQRPGSARRTDEKDKDRF